MKKLLLLGAFSALVGCAPDLALADASASDYAGLVIAGGWGATTYFYDFPRAGKPILGVCNGVNVLSWARVTGTSDSPLKGKTVSAPYQSVPAMKYKNVDYGDGSSLWMTQFPADNDATVAPKNSVGDDELDTDDVSVDGLILTAQDNNAVYVGGQKLAELL